MPQFSCFTPHFLMSHSHFLRCDASFFTRKTRKTQIKSALRGVKECEKQMWIITIFLSTNYFFEHGLTGFHSFIFSFLHLSAAQFFLIFSFQRSTFAAHFFSIFWKKSTTSVVSQFYFVNLQCFRKSSKVSTEQLHIEKRHWCFVFGYLKLPQYR